MGAVRELEFSLVEGGRLAKAFQLLDWCLREKRWVALALADIAVLACEQAHTHRETSANY